MRASFRLPGVDQLNRSQNRAINTPDEGCNLIVGGPGTGKSVIALIKMKNLFKKNKNVQFLAYNRVLQEYTRQLCKSQGIIDTPISGYLTWLHNNLNNWFYGIDKDQEKDPSLKPPDNYDYKYLMDLEPKASEFRHRYLIIDEGQDMPPDFYGLLRNAGFVNYFVAADQNQIITKRNSSRIDIEYQLDIDTEDTILLTDNYRNTRNIALVTSHFYPNDPASPSIKLPENRSSSYQKPILYHYDDLQDVFESIMQKYDQNTNKLIGVIVPNNKILETFRNGLSRVSPNLIDHRIPKIQYYISGPQNRYIEPINWSEGGIVVLNSASCKGTEFDTVFIADIDEHCWDRDDKKSLMKKFYVMSSRAREELYFLRDNVGEHKSLIDEIFPVNDKNSDGDVIIKEEDL